MPLYQTFVCSVPLLFKTLDPPPDSFRVFILITWGTEHFKLPRILIVITPFVCYLLLPSFYLTFMATTSPNDYIRLDHFFYLLITQTNTLPCVSLHTRPPIFFAYWHIIGLSLPWLYPFTINGVEQRIIMHNTRYVNHAEAAPSLSQSQHVVTVWRQTRALTGHLGAAPSAYVTDTCQVSACAFTTIY